MVVILFVFYVRHLVAESNRNTWSCFRQCEQHILVDCPFFHMLICVLFFSAVFLLAVLKILSSMIAEGNDFMIFMDV